MAKKLTNITFTTATNNWYAPTKELKEKYPSIKVCKLMDTTSSAGDWYGFIIQQIAPKKYIAIGFSQTNLYPHDGFGLQTCEHPFYSGKELTAEFILNVENCWLQFDND